MMDWTVNDNWILLIGVLCAVACGLLGNFLVLRRMSMMGDAISHAVLLGIAIMFLLTGSRDSMTIILGAAVVGVLTAVFTQLVHQWGKVDAGASMGVVFTTLFAIGLILIVRGADKVDLDPGCVLYGGIEYAPLDMTEWLGITMPRAVFVMGSILLINLVFVVVFFKELKISSFDPALATTLGINATVMHFLLMIMVALTAVAAFEIVGSILVVAMLIVPGATAHLLTDRLRSMIMISAIVAILGAGLGLLGAIVTPAWIGFPDKSASIAGMMAAASGGVFLLALLGAPRHGVISRLGHRFLLSLKIIREDMLGFLYRLEELHRDQDEPVGTAMLSEAIGCGKIVARISVFVLGRGGMIERKNNRPGYSLTPVGREAATSLVRSHRLWETYLAHHFKLPLDHVHLPATKLEHVTDEAMQEQLAQEMQQPTFDPHGKRVP